jgi:hypothetical protein
MTTFSHRTPKVIRLVLGVFPTAFRTRYGHEIWQCIRDARRDLGNESFVLTIRFWIGIMADLGRSACVEWCRSISRQSYILALRRTAGAVLIAAAFVNVAYDAMSVKLSMGVLTALLTALVAITGGLLIRNRPGKAP